MRRLTETFNTDSWREVDAVQKFSKSAISTEIIEFWIDFQHIKPPGVFHTCLLQELEGFLGFTEASSVQGLLVRIAQHSN